MDYARLGASGLQVSRLCLGTMVLGRWGNEDHDDCARIVRRALDEGVTLVDTANRYGMGESEEILGKALAGRRAEAVIATKVFMPGPGGVLDRGTSRRHVFLQVEESLRRLRTDWIDLYQIHRNDRDTPLEETLGALTDLVRVHHLIQTGAGVAPEERLLPGSHVIITAGPMAGLEGKVIRRDKHYRFFVEVRFLQRGVSVEIDSSMIQPR